MASLRFRTALAPSAAFLAAAFAAALAAPAPPARALPLADAPSLTHLDVEPDGMRAWTDPDSTGQVLAVIYDARARRWSPPAPWTPPAGLRPDSLAAVRVFAGGLFDKFSGPTLGLGDGFTLAHRDTGYALVRDADGHDFGWPRVSDEDIDKWGPEVRVGLPRDYPEDRLRVLLGRGQLKNEPGPTTVADGMRWFGLKGGFVGGAGQIGGLVGFDRARGTFTVRRHYGLVEASVTRLYAREGELWIGTARFGENALQGTAGLLLYRPARNEWRQFSTRNSRIAGDLVWDILAAPDGLWVTTDGGVSRYNFDHKNWTSWYWHMAGQGGGYVLTDRPRGDLDTESTP